MLDVSIVLRQILTIAALALVPMSATAQQTFHEPPPQGADRPMTGAERIHWIVDGTIGPKSLGVGVFAAAWNTAWNVPEEWGQTWSGAGKRYLEREADVSISNTIEGGLGAIWGERPDYIRSGRAGFRPRLSYALKTVFLAYRPDGHLAPAWGRYAGNTVNNLIENTWLPPSATTWGQTTWRSASGFGTRAIGNVWEEFQPEIMRVVFRRKK
jgi:hypothetical protein